MSEFPRAQKIAALVLVSLVVVLTLVVVATRDGAGDTSALTTPDPDSAPTAADALVQPRQQWSSIAETARGAQGTSSPVTCPFIDERAVDQSSSLSFTPALTFVCATANTTVSPVAPGRVVMRVDQAPLNTLKAELVANGNDGPWLRAGAYGPFVVVDHGPLNEVSNVTSVYAGFGEINSGLRVGQLVDTATELGTLAARQVGDQTVNGVLSFEFVTDDTRFGADPVRQAPGSSADSPRLAEAAAAVMSPPVTTCTIPFGNPNLLVGAERAYRSGIHNGLDFNCLTTDHQVTAAGAGQVIFVVNDYVDASTQDRDAVLAQTVPAFDTPFWTLAALYGNFVVIDHELTTGERAVTIYAHLSEVDESIVPGRIVAADTLVGFVGNSGTSAASAGITNNDGSVHLHWELHVNDRPIGFLETPQETEPLYQTILCDPATPNTPDAC